MPFDECKGAPIEAPRLVLSPLVMGRADRPHKITFAAMRDSGVRGILVYCQDFHCSHSLAISADRWPDEVRLSDIEPRFICGACGKRGGNIRPDFNCDKVPVKVTGYR
jgi:hypothetical protein